MTPSVRHRAIEVYYYYYYSDCSNRRTEHVQPQQGQEGRSRDRRAAAGTGGQQQGQEGSNRDRRTAAGTGGQKQQHRHATAVNLIDYRMRYKLGVDVYNNNTILISVQYVA